MLNGIAMAICGSSRPASGSEHLISHALDRDLAAGRACTVCRSAWPATWSACCRVKGAERIDAVLAATGFWDGVAADPFDRAEWRRAVRLAPALKDDFYTVLHARDCRLDVERHLQEDPRLRRCFTAA